MIQGILLAAGASTRFGANKLLHEFADGLSVAEHAARNLCAALPGSLAVVRAGDRELTRRFRALGLDVIECATADAGLSASLGAGLRAVAGADGWIVALADMPWIAPATIGRIESTLHGGATLVAPEFRGQRGHPVGFGREWFAPLLRLHGDTGARKLLETHEDRLVRVVVDDAGVVADIDVPGDIARAARISER